jgi:DNA-binding protein HU-beta
MTKAELIEKVHKEHGGEMSKKAVGDIVEGTFNVIAKSIKKEKRFGFPSFGTFTVRERAARLGRNPQTGASIKIAKSKAVKFKAAPELKKSL